MTIAAGQVWTDEVFPVHSARLHPVALRVTGNTADAEDLVRETSRCSWPGTPSAGNWLAASRAMARPKTRWSAASWMPISRQHCGRGEAFCEEW